MRAGQLDSLIEIQRRVTTLDTYGVPTDAWELVARMRAAVMDYAIADREGQRGSTTETSTTFRTRYLADVTLEHRVIYDGDAYTIKNIRELGRARGLDLRCERAGQ